MVRQLYAADLIEKFGEPIKHVTRGNLLGHKQPPTEGSPSAAATTGQKRKADDKEVCYYFPPFSLIA